MANERDQLSALVVQTNDVTDSSPWAKHHETTLIIGEDAIETPMASAKLTTAESREKIRQLLMSRQGEWIPALALGEVFGIDYQKIDCRPNSTSPKPITGHAGFKRKDENYRITYGDSAHEDTIKNRVFFRYLTPDEA